MIGYSGDSGPSDGLAELARDADLFVCEATLLAPNPEGGLRGHLSAEEAVAAFEASGAKRLLLTHRPFERPLDGTFELAHDGLQIDVSRLERRASRPGRAASRRRRNDRSSLRELAEAP